MVEDSKSIIGTVIIQPQPISMAYSIADQNFVNTKSIGILNLSLHLLENLSPRPEFQKLEVISNSSLSGHLTRVSGRPIHLFDQAFATRPGRIFWDQWRVYSEAVKLGVDWLFLPKGFASFCRKPKIKVATYVHDVIGEFYRERYPGAVSGAEAWYFQQSLCATLQRSSVIFTNSEFTRSELLRLGGRHSINLPEIVVVGIGFSNEKVSASAKKNLIIVLASPWPHKRTVLAVEFMSRWQRSTKFDGEIHWVGRFPERLALPSHPRWKHDERLEMATFRSLMLQSRAVVYFSEYEGFGMPPVESVLAGACPVYSRISATREIMHDLGAPFENNSFESFADAMEKALGMQPEQLSAEAATLLRRHNWPEVVDRIVRVLANKNTRG